MVFHLKHSRRLLVSRPVIGHFLFRSSLCLQQLYFSIGQPGRDSWVVCWGVLFVHFTYHCWSVQDPTMAWGWQSALPGRVIQQLTFACDSYGA